MHDDKGILVVILLCVRIIVTNEPENAKWEHIVSNTCRGATSILSWIRVGMGPQDGGRKASRSVRRVGGLGQARTSMTSPVNRKCVTRGGGHACRGCEQHNAS